MSAACPVFGLVLRLEGAPHVNRAALLNELRTMLLQPRGLVATVLDQATFAITGDGFQATDADREALVGWLNAQRLVARYEVSQLGDVGHAL